MAKTGRHLTLKVPGLAENRPSVLKGDELFVEPVSGRGQQSFRGFVTQVKELEVYLEFGKGLTNM